MTTWYGECALVKLDVTAAFDTVPWDKIYEALVANEVPPALATALLHLQQSGFVSEWEGVQGECVFVPTRGTRQGCKLGPLLYKIFVEHLLRPITASWKWAPKPTSTRFECIGVETFGPDENFPDLYHILLYADDIY
eukprot:6463897-Amphidinium_carterae.1